MAGFVDRTQENKLSGLPCVWHQVPPRMHGQHLLPLKELLKDSPEIAAGYLAKYAGRDFIRQLHIPILDCNWDEVIFLSPIHPQLITDGFHKVGLSLKQISSFQIPADALAGHEVVSVDLTLSGVTASNTVIAREAVTPWYPDTYRSRELSPATTNYYRQMAEKDHRPLTLSHEPHILVRGYHRDGTPHPLDISRTEIITTAPTPNRPRDRY